MPRITIKAIEGRTVKQKRGLIKDITDAFVKNFSVPPEAVAIEIIEFTKENMAGGGKLFCDK